MWAARLSAGPGMCGRGRNVAKPVLAPILSQRTEVPVLVCRRSPVWEGRVSLALGLGSREV